MIDIHCHILHDIDDGAQTLEDAVRLCRCAVENEITTAVATSHLANPVDTDNFIRRRDRRLDELRRELDRQKIELEVLPGAEVFVNDDLFFAPPLDKVTLNGSRYLLIEFDFRGLNINRLIKYVREVRARGHVPIIAHPERYQYTQENYDIINHLAEMGTLFQLNADCLAGLGGPREGALAHAMAANGLAQFIASDAHSVRHRPNNMLRLGELFPPDIPDSVYDNLLISNPKKIINDEDLKPVGFYPIARPRFY